MPNAPKRKLALHFLKTAEQKSFQIPVFLYLSKYRLNDVGPHAVKSTPNRCFELAVHEIPQSGILGNATTLVVHAMKNKKLL